MKEYKKHIYNDELIVNYDKKYTGMNFPFFHCHNVYEIYILESGERTMVMDDVMYKTYGGDAAMIHPNILHRSLGETPYSGICINFSDQYLYKYFSERAKEDLLKCFSKPVIHLNSDELNRIHELSDKIINEKNNTFVYLCDILNILSYPKSDSPYKNRIADVPKLNPIISYIDTNFREINSLDDISNALHINKNYLCGLFKRKTGMTVSSYINALRIQLSCSMLTETTNTVEEIGIKCGFASTSYFCRIFKKSLNTTPSDFRKKALGIEK